MKKPKTIATICARGGSKGLPGKNIKILCGKPLLSWTIEQALETTEIDEVYVSTDCPNIAEVARATGAIVPFLRPKELATDTISKIPTIIHLVQVVEKAGTCVGKVVDLDPTSPLRTSSDITNALSMLNDSTDVVITGFLSDKNPYFNMVEEGPGGSFQLVKKPDSDVFSRQAAPNVYAMNASIYCWHRSSLSRGIWQDNVGFYLMPRERSIDIDSQLDFEIVEMLLSRRRS